MPHTYSRSELPHIRDSASTGHVFWGAVAASSPVILAACLAHGLEAFFLFLTCAGACLLAEWLSGWVWQRPVFLGNGHSVYQALLVFICLSARVPVWVAAAGCFISTFLFKEAAGGLGRSPFSPALAALLMIQAVHPSADVHPIFEAQGMGARFLLNHSPDLPMGAASMAALLCVFLFLILAKKTAWEIPVIFGASHAALAVISGVDSSRSIMTMAAVMLMTDDASLPASRAGRRRSSVIAGCLSVFCLQHPISIGAFVSAIFLTGLFSQMMDGLKYAPTHRTVKLPAVHG